ncbi:MAG: hypothetical protein ABJ081_02475 [Hyphomicrobiales bacterium]
MLVPQDEIRSSLTGALRILFKDPKALSYFNMTPDGFWHSFKAIWIVFVPLSITLLIQRGWLMSEHGLSLEAFPSAIFFATKIFGFGLEWAMMPFVLWILADQLDIKTRYSPFIIARNWASIVMGWVYFIPTLTHVVGLINLDAMVFSQLILLGFVLIYSFRVARATLDKPILFCMALVFVDLIIGLLIGGTLWSFIEPTLVAPKI